MKKTISILLILTLAISLCACGTSGNTNSSAAPAPSDASPSNAAPSDTTPSDTAPSDKEESVKWPSGKVTVYIPFDVGSGNDISFRLMCDYLAEVTGYDFIYENDSVASGARSAALLANAEPDGHTLMIGGSNLSGMYYQGFWENNFADTNVYRVVAGGTGPNPYTGTIVCTNPGNDFGETWQDFCDYVLANPGTVTVGCTPGKASEVKTKVLFDLFGLTDSVRYVSCNDAEMVTGVLGNSISVAVISEDKFLPYWEDGSMKAIFNYRKTSDTTGINFTDEQREFVENLECLEDYFSGDELDNAFILLTNYIIAPAGTPDEICEQIFSTMASVRENEEWFERVKALSPSSGYWAPDSIAEMEAEIANTDRLISSIYGEG